MFIGRLYPNVIHPTNRKGKTKPAEGRTRRSKYYTKYIEYLFTAIKNMRIIQKKKKDTYVIQHTRDASKIILYT